MADCRECGTVLLGDREPIEGICYSCKNPAPPRRVSKWKRRKPLTAVCRECGVRFALPLMGAPGLYCSDDCWNAVRRRRWHERKAEREGVSA